MSILLTLYIASGLLLIALSLPLMRGKVPPNVFYGFRVSQTLNNPEIWYAANRFSGKRLLAAGMSTIIAAIALYWIPGISLDGYALGCLAVFALVFMIGLLQSFHYIKKQS